MTFTANVENEPQMRTTISVWVMFRVLEGF